MKKIFFFLIITLVQICEAATQVKLTQQSGSSTFLAIGYPSAIRIEGKGEAPSGDLIITEENKIVHLAADLKLNLKSYSTGIDLRDRHMKEKYFEIDKFENASLKIQDLQFEKNILNSEIETKIPFNGTLNFHGIDKVVQGELFVKKVKDQIQIASTFKLNISDFKMNIPTFAGIKVTDSVEIKTLNLMNVF